MADSQTAGSTAADSQAIHGQAIHQSQAVDSQASHPHTTDRKAINPKAINPRPLDPRVELILGLADDELILGTRHSHWTGVAPHLEEDLAFSSIAQDEVGHAVVWYRLAADLLGAEDPSALQALAPAAAPGADIVDAIGLGREPGQYRHAILTERPNRDWGYTIARHYLYDVAEDVRLATLAESAWPALAQATGALRREERYHLLHARLWLRRLAGGPVEARIRLTDGLLGALAEAPGLFEPPAGETELLTGGVLARSFADQQLTWWDRVAADLAEVDLDHLLGGSVPLPAGDFVPTSSGALIPADERPADAGRGLGAPGGPDGLGGLGGRHGRHSPDFPAVWEELTGVYRAHPGARW